MTAPPGGSGPSGDQDPAPPPTGGGPVTGPGSPWGTGPQSGQPGYPTPPPGPPGYGPYGHQSLPGPAHPHPYGRSTFGPPLPGGRPPRRLRRVLLGTALALVVAALVVVALLAFVVGPRFAVTDVLDADAVQRGVAGVVTEDWKRTITDVRCPPREPVRPGTTFTCRAVVDGRPQQVPVTVTDATGTYEVGQPR